MPAKRRSVIALPLLGIIIAALIFILPSRGSNSFDDVESIIVSQEGAECAVITDDTDVAAFLTWLKDFVPEEKVMFVAENAGFISDEASLSAVVKSNPGENGVTYMYLFTDANAIVYNGEPYLITEQDFDNFRAFAEMETAE